MKNYNCYVGGGFLQSQLIWILPIVKNFSSNINKIIIDSSSLDLNFLKKKEKQKIKVIRNLYKLKLKNLFYLLINFFLVIKYLKIFFYEKNPILKKKDWFEIQFRHSIWDNAIQMMNDKQLKPNFYQILKSILISVICLHNIKKLHNKYNFKIAFLGHTVYQNRIIFAFLRLKNVKIFTQANFNLHKQLKKKDIRWDFLSKKKLKYLIKALSKKTTDRYWEKRCLGQSNYYDAKIASNLKNKLYNYPKNVIFLHIFKDSPFNCIDKNRIFSDYFDWIIHTFKIIKYSKETWSVRLHPNHKRWGENQKEILSLLIKKYLKDYEQKKILIDDKKISNTEILKNVKKVVTFSGTSHLEASCNGIKPIVISNVMLGEFSKNYILKPKNILSYRKLLLDNSNDKKFKQSKKIINISKKLIFIRENLLSIQNDIGGLSIYRNDKKNIRKKEIKSINQKIKKNKNYLLELSMKLKNGSTHTFSKNYIKLC